MNLPGRLTFRSLLVRTTLLAGGVLMVAGCDGMAPDPNATLVADAGPSHEGSTPDLGPVRGAEGARGVVRRCGPGVPNDPVAIQEAELDGDILNLEVSYSGGCRDHRLALCWNGLYAESMPPQVWLWVAHDANGDMCEGLVAQAASIDLSRLGDGGDIDRLFVHLEGWEESFDYVP